MCWCGGRQQHTKQNTCYVILYTGIRNIINSTNTNSNNNDTRHVKNALRILKPVWFHAFISCIVCTRPRNTVYVSRIIGISIIPFHLGFIFPFTPSKGGMVCGLLWLVTTWRNMRISQNSQNLSHHMSDCRLPTTTCTEYTISQYLMRGASKSPVCAEQLFIHIKYVPWYLVRIYMIYPR